MSFLFPESFLVSLSWVVLCSCSEHPCLQSSSLCRQVLDSTQEATRGLLEDYDFGASHKTRPSSGKVVDSGRHVQGRVDGDFRKASEGIWTTLQQYACSLTCEDGGVKDLVVVGGGLSGLYAAWRIKASRPNLNVSVVEGSERFGGRLYSVFLPGMDHIAADLGGMHYVDRPSVMLNSWLVDEYFKLPSRPFASNFSDAHVRTVLRGARLSPADLKNATLMAELYRLTAAERAGYKNPLQFCMYLMKKILPTLEKKSFDPWKARTISGGRLLDMSFGEALRFANASDGALQLLSDSTGFESLIYGDLSASAMTSLLLKYAMPETTFRVPQDGMEALPNELVRRLRSLGVQLKSSRLVKGIFRCGGDPGEKSYQSLLVEDGSSTGGVTICAQQVIVTLTQKDLDSLLWRPLTQQPFWKNVQGTTATKIYLGFDRPYWREAPFGFYEGTITTTQDIGRIFFIGSEEDFPDRTTQDGTAPSGTNRNSLVLASYSSDMHSDIWIDLSVNTSSLSPFKGHPNPFENSSKPILPTTGRFVTVELVDRVVKELSFLGGENILLPQPYTAVVYHWQLAVHWWKPLANATELIGISVKPSEADNVYMCGEVFSKDQGWAEGALRSAEYMLQTCFSLEPLAGMPLKWMEGYAVPPAGGCRPLG